MTLACPCGKSVSSLDRGNVQWSCGPESHAFKSLESSMVVGESTGIKKGNSKGTIVDGTQLVTIT
jgi:hypothetical protein